MQNRSRLFMVLVACLLGMCTGTESWAQRTVPTGRKCYARAATNAQPSDLAESRRRLETDVVAETTPQRIVIPVVFHVIHDGQRGKVCCSVLAKQLRVLNKAFNKHGIVFQQHRPPTYCHNPTWYRMASADSGETTSSAERAAKCHLAVDPRRVLNIYTTFTSDYENAPYGWAYQPYDDGLKSEPFLDGVIVLHTTLPDQCDPNCVRFQGMTAVHEVGHWLGLLHTYQCACDDKAQKQCCCAPNEAGDQVADTPAHLDQSEEHGGQPPLDLDSCPNSPGTDPIHNYMSYSHDDLVNEFTAGQVERMKLMAEKYRPELFPPYQR